MFHDDKTRITVVNRRRTIRVVVFPRSVNVGSPSRSHCFIMEGVSLGTAHITILVEAITQEPPAEVRSVTVIHPVI